MNNPPTEDCLGKLLDITSDVVLLENRYKITCTAILDSEVEFVCSCPMSVFTMPTWLVQRIASW